MIILLHKRSRIVLSTVLLVFFSGCFYDKEELMYPETTAASTASFAGDIQPMITQNCAIGGCHVSGGQSPALTTYAVIFSNRDRIKARAVNGSPSPMPAAGLMSKTNRDKLAVWINQGAPNN